MAFVLADRVQQTGTANTTVSFTLSGSVTGYQSFSVIGNTNTTYYAATDGSGNWEVGLGTYSTTGPTLTRTTILASSNAGSAVTFSGTVTVFVVYPAGKSVNLDSSGNVSALGTIASGVWQGTTVAVGYGGTGATTLTANNVILGNGTSAVQFVAPGTSGNLLTSNGTTWTSAAPAAASLTITDDTATNATYYPSFVTATSGTTTSLRTSSSKLTYNPSTGTLTSTVLTASSDENLKTNWRSLSDLIAGVASVKNGEFDWLDGSGSDVGVSAQSLLKVLPMAVKSSEKGELSVNYGAAALVTCIQLCQRVLALEAEVENLKKGAV